MEPRAWNDLLEAFPLARAALLASIFPQLPWAGFLSLTCMWELGSSQLLLLERSLQPVRAVMANAALAAAARSVLTHSSTWHWL